MLKLCFFGRHLPSDYLAQLWLGQGETYHFETKFLAGSHLTVDWRVVDPPEAQVCATVPGVPPSALVTHQVKAKNLETLH